MKSNWTSIWLYDNSQEWNIEYVTCEPHEWMRSLWYEYSYMCTIWKKMMMRLWFSKYVYVACAQYEWGWWWDYDSQNIYIYVTCALHEQDDETMLNECFMCITQSFVPQYHNAVIRILWWWWWVAGQPHQKCGAIGRGVLT